MATQKLLSTLSEPEFLLVRETEAGELRALDEDALLDLHARVRRARNKHVGVYRRSGAARVKTKGARGQARTGSAKNAARAEVFEEALGRVSRQLAIAANASARQLKEERIAQARGEIAPAKKAAAPAKKAAAPAKKAAAPAKKAAAPAKPAKKAVPQKRVLADKTRQSSGRIKREAGTRATGARRQAKRDSR